MTQPLVEPKPVDAAVKPAQRKLVLDEIAPVDCSVDVIESPSVQPSRYEYQWFHFWPLE